MFFSVAYSFATYSHLLLEFLLEFGEGTSRVQLLTQYRPVLVDQNDRIVLRLS